MKTAPVKRKEPLREKICYYIDDGNIPEEIHERIMYLGSSRNFLARVVIKGYRFLRERHLEYEFREWYRKQDGC